jgi:tryptophan halogenase
MSRKVQRVVVVGRDAAAWLTALGLRWAFGRVGVEVELCELPSRLTQADACVALPMLSGLHRLLAIADADAISACSGTPVLAQRFANWSGGGRSFLHAYDTQPVGVNGVDILQYWVKARAAGMQVAFDEFSLGAGMARQGRYIDNGDVSDSFTRPAHGFHLDARAYVRFIAKRALAAGVRRTEANLAEVKVEGDRIASIRLADGRTLEADLFIDASGVEAALIGKLPGDGFESWRPLFGCDRLLVASGQRLDPTPAFSQIAAFRSGWIGLHPLQDRTAVVAAYDSSAISDQGLLETIAVTTGMRLTGPAASAAFEPGLRARPWIGNCIAIGDAAIALEPLDAAPLQVVQIGLSHLIHLFPVDADEPAEAAAYNRVVAAHARNLRDFQLAHYRLNRRFDEPFWDRARDAEVPESLAYKLRLFESRGEAALYDHETFEASNWAAILIGHGLIPRGYDPRVDMLPESDQIRQLQKMLQFIAATVQQAPKLDARLTGPAA